MRNFSGSWMIKEVDWAFGLWRKTAACAQAI